MSKLKRKLKRDLKEEREKIKNEMKQDRAELERRIKAIKPSRLVTLCIMIVITICSYVFYEYFFGTKNGWCTNPDTGTALFDNVLKLIPILVSCIQGITILLTLVTITVVVIRKTFSKTQRGITVSSLVCNLISWLTAIIIVIIVLSNFGVDTTALITGAGVVTLVVGLGMQSLIADIVAGLFIVFENTFNVGDFITVDGYRGEVIAIGIRTTKLKAAGNVKIINNNSITSVLNHDMDLSIAKTLIDVEYGDRLPEIEQKIKANIGNLQIDGAVDAVSYDGVASLGASGVTLQFTCHCYEKDIFSTNRALNAAVKNMFDENGIGIPFPQIVVHNGDK